MGCEMAKRNVEYDENGEIVRGISGRQVLSSSYVSKDYGISFSEPTRNSTTVSSNSVTTSSPSSTTYSGGSHFSSGSEKSCPKLAFEYEGIEYWGSAHSNLDDAGLCNHDLLINGFGAVYTAKPFVKTAPSWLNLAGLSGSDPHQLLLDWRDFSPPPRSINIDFWESIVEQAKAEGIKRIVVCCGAGLGRTGTALASLALASGFTNDPIEAINTVRAVYNSRAIETRAQELYVWCLVNSSKDFPESGIQRAQQNKSGRQISLGLEEDPEESWSLWPQNNPKK